MSLVESDRPWSIESVPTDVLWSFVFGRRLGEALAKEPANLRRLRASSVCEIAEEYGVTPAKARRVSAVLQLATRLVQEPMVRGKPFGGAAAVHAHFHPELRDLKVERFFVVFLDGKHRFMSAHLVSQGTLTSSPVHPREVFREAIRRSAAAVVLVHNHPSGDPTPSADDLAITRRLVEVGDLVGIRVLDHVVIGDGAYVSLADRGLLR